MQGTGFEACVPVEWLPLAADGQADDVLQLKAPTPRPLSPHIQSLALQAAHHRASPQSVCLQRPTIVTGRRETAFTRVAEMSRVACVWPCGKRGEGSRIIKPVHVRLKAPVPRALGPPSCTSWAQLTLPNLIGF